MSVTSSAPIVGVFNDRSMADQAIDALFNAGFQQEHIRQSTPNSSGGFFEDLKSLFTGAGTNAGNFADELTSMGLSDEDAHYYAHEYNNGKTLLVVQAPDRQQEALSVLHQYGAYTSSNAAGTEMNSAPQTSEPVQQRSYATDQPQSPYATSTNQPAEFHSQATTVPDYDIENENTQPIPSGNRSETYTTPSDQSAAEAETQSSQSQYDAANYTDNSTPVQENMNDPENTAHYSSPQQETVSQGAFPGTVGSNVPDWTVQPVDAMPETYQPIQSSQTNESTPAYHETTPEYQEESPAYNREDPATQASVSETVAAPETQMAQPDTATSETETMSPDTATPEAQPMQTDTAAPDMQPDTAASEPVDEHQQLQNQLSALQQQLQEAKAQLQAAKDRETQLKTAREREQQLEAARQQIRELQSELAETLAELRDTQTRLSQYE